MMRTSRRIVGTLLAFAMAVAVAAAPPVVPGEAAWSRLEQVIKDEEPGWKLARRIAGRRHTSQDWELGHQRVSVHVSVHDSVAAAEAAFVRGAATVSVGLPEDVSDVGERAHIWRTAQDSTVRLEVLQDNALLTINAPSEDVARRFARRLLKRLATG